MLTKDTHTIQSALATYCRTNEPPQLPGVTPNRIPQYRRLVYNIIDDTFQGAFPITQSFLSEEEWHELVDGFFSDHACQTPSIWKLPFELYEYIAGHSSHALKNKYPFLSDLLYFEWLEIDVHTMPDAPVEKYTATGDWLRDRLYVNPEFQLVQLAYPVHQHKPVELLADPRKGSYFVLIFREPESGRVQFFNLSPLFAFMVSQLSGSENNLDFILSQTCSLFGIERNAAVEESTRQFIEQMQQSQFVLGFAAGK